MPGVPPAIMEMLRLPNSNSTTAAGPVSRFRTVASGKVWVTEGELDVHTERLATSSSKISPSRVCVLSVTPEAISVGRLRHCGTARWEATKAMNTEQLILPSPRPCVV